jgi:type I restriction enzyme, S subunit
MKLSDNLRRRGWRKSILGDHIALSNGKRITSSQMEADKPIPVYGSGSIIGYTDKPLVFYDTIVIGRVGACGTVQIAKAPCWISDNAMYVTQIKPGLDFHFLFFLLNYLRLGTLASRTTQPSLPQGPILNHDFPLPPLPVQERIVQILQKADEIRRKRKEALELVDKILPALFLEMFGDPATNPKGWPIHRLGDVLQSCNSGVWGKQTSDESRGFYVLRSTNMPLDGRIDYSDVALIEIPDKKAQRYALQDGDILLNRSSGSPEHIGKVSLFRQKPEIHKPILFSNFVQRLRVNPEVMTPEYLFFFLRSDFARESLNKLHATSSGLRNIQMKEYLAQEVPVPPLPLQQYFSQVVILYEEIWKRRADTFQTSETLFQTMLVQAFTGELTAEWEAANAEWIAERQAFYERLPRLVILALLAEKAKRAGRAAATVLITALMKYVFLFQMEGNGGRRRLYQFVPYHYGPFSKEVYADLEALEQEGLVRVEKDPEEEKTKITLADAAKIEERLAMLPDDIKQDVAVIIETYGDLDHATLLSTVYEKYPAYARKSQLKRKGRRAQ